MSRISRPLWSSSRKNSVPIHPCYHPCELPENKDLIEIYVGNIPFASTEQEIRGLFNVFGAVERVSIVTDRETGRPRGFCFAGMTNEDEARAAIDALNGVELRGRGLVINQGRAREQRPGRQR